MLLSRGMATMKEKGKRRKEQWRRQGGGIWSPQSSRQEDISILLNHRCKKRFKKLQKPLKT